MNRSPSASSARNRPRASSLGAACGRGTKTTTSAAETRKLAASSQRAVVAPNAATSTPPIGAPTSVEPCWIARADAAGALHPRAGELDDVGEERGARRRSGRVEERADEDERHELPELDPDRRVQQRDRRDGAGAREIGDDARRPEAEPVDDDAAEERRRGRSAGS